MCLLRRNLDVNEIVSVEMPIGSYTGCKVHPTCGLYSPEGVIGMEDTEYSFYDPEKIRAGLFWTSAGYVEYKFANAVPKNRHAKSLSLSMEICSEAPGYREDWKSDITVWINGVDCGTWTCPGDFGSRKRQTESRRMAGRLYRVRNAHDLGDTWRRLFYQWKQGSGSHTGGPLPHGEAIH